MHAWLIGGTGFLGSAIARRLRADESRVTVTGRAEWDGTTDAFAAMFRADPPDVVFLLAAHYVAEHTAGDLDALIDANIRLPYAVFEAMRLTGVRRIVTAGTFWQEFSEEDPSPVNLYAATRCAARDALRYYANAFGWSACHLRVSDLYGPNDGRRKLFTHLRHAGLTGETVAMSPGEQLVPLLHVEDAAAAFTLAAFCPSGEPFSEYALMPDEAVSLRDVVALYAEVIGRPIPVDFGGRPYRDREVMVPHCGPRLPGWRPTVTLRAGLEDMERHDAATLP